MFQNITQNQTGADVSIEIFIMLLGAFILGMLFSWALQPKEQKNITKKSPSKKKNKSSKSIVVEQETIDDLTLIEWINGKIVKLLNKNNIFTFSDLAQKDVFEIEKILSSAGMKFQIYSPTTWPDQWELASNQKWSELEEYQEILNTSRKNKTS